MNIGSSSSLPYCTLHIRPLKMEQIECSETSAFNNQTPGKYPKDYTLSSSCHFVMYSSRSFHRYAKQKCSSCTNNCPVLQLVSRNTPNGSEQGVKACSKHYACSFGRQETGWPCVDGDCIGWTIGHTVSIHTSLIWE